ncbi:MAG: hypothetical protein ABIR11_05800 [Candidatus Limnocylindrales bacterium]
MDDQETRRIDPPALNDEPVATGDERATNDEPAGTPARDETPAPADGPFSDGPPPPPVPGDPGEGWAGGPPPPPPPQVWPQAGGWAPGPPQAAALDIGSLLGRTFDTLGREWSLFLALSIPAGIGGLITVVVSRTFNEIMTNPYAPQDPVSSFAGAIISVIASVITALGVIVATDRLWRGQQVGLVEALSAGARRLPVLIGLYLLLVVAVIGIAIAVTLAFLLILQAGPIGALLLVLVVLAIIPVAFYAEARLTVILPVVVLEDQGPIDSVRRAWRVTKGSVLLLFVGLILISLVAAISTWGASMLLLFSDSRVVAGVALVLATMISAPLSGIWMTLAYGDLTGRGYGDSELMARGKGRNVGALIVFGVGILLLLVGGAIAGDGFQRLLESLPRR